MKALTINQYGKADKLEMRELSTPVPAIDDVLVEVRMASINPFDWKIRRGDLSYILPKKFPRVLGVDVSGIVLQVGSAVTKFKIGDQVFGMANPFRNQYGSYAEKTLVQESNLAIMPESLSFENAAAIPVAGLTAYKALFEIGGLKAGEHVLINGAAGGVGSFAVQLAKNSSAKITATCGPNNIDFVRSLGADEVINYNSLDLKLLGQKFAIIFDASAKLDFWKTRHLLTNNGVFIGTTPKPELLLAVALTPLFGGKRAAVVLASAGKNVSRQLSELGELVCNGALRPEICKIVPLNEVAAAHAEAEKEHTRGKILVSLQ